MGADFLISIGNSMSFRRTRAKSIIKHDTLRGGEKLGGTRAKRVDEDSGFANLQFFSQKRKFYYKTQAITIFFTRKEDPELYHFTTKPLPESNLSMKA